MKPRGRVGSFKARLTEEERERVTAMLEVARSRASKVKRDGREYVVLKLPDNYPRGGPTGGFHLRDSEQEVLEDP